MIFCVLTRSGFVCKLYLQMKPEIKPNFLNELTILKQVQDDELGVQDDHAVHDKSGQAGRRDDKGFETVIWRR